MVDCTLFVGFTIQDILDSIEIIISPVHCDKVELDTKWYPWDPCIFAIKCINLDVNLNLGT